MSAAKCVAALRAFVDGGPAAAQIFTRRWRGSAGENTSAGIELWRAGVVLCGCQLVELAVVSH
jgi:hypothetical protein